MSRDEKLKANQRRLAARRRAKRMAQAMTKKPKTEKPKTSKPKTSNATRVAFDKKNDFGASLRSKPTPQRKPPTAPPPVTQEKKKDPPKPTPPSNKAVKGGYTISGGQRKAGTRGSTNPMPMPSNPAVGYSKPVRRNFKTQAAFLKALETYMRKKKRGEQAASSTGKGKAKRATDGRQYGG